MVAEQYTDLDISTQCHMEYVSHRCLPQMCKGSHKHALTLHKLFFSDRACNLMRFLIKAKLTYSRTSHFQLFFVEKNVYEPVASTFLCANALILCISFVAFASRLSLHDQLPCQASASKQITGSDKRTSPPMLPAATKTTHPVEILRYSEVTRKCS